MRKDNKIDTTLKAIDFNPFKNGYEIEKIVAMNEPQRLMWLSCLIGGDGASLAYNESMSLDFKGTFNLSVFEDAIKEVIARHEALRAVVSGNGESIIIYKNIPFANAYHDLSSFPDQELQIKTFIAKEMQNVFDLQEGPLIRTFIHKLSDTHHYFTVVGHHIFCDGWSLGIILENIAKIYNAKLNGRAIALDKADQISDYAIEMAEFKNSKLHEQVKDYWLDVYKDGAPTLDFPTDYPRPLNRNFRSNRYDHAISFELVAKLKKLGAANGSSLVNTLLSAFELFIYLKTKQLDLIVGMPTAGQAATEKFELVGHCVNLLALRSKIDVKMSFSNYLVKRKKDFFDAYENQKFTLGELVESLDQKKDYSRIPLLPILFNVDMGLDTAASFDNLDYELISNPRIFETFEIFLNATGSKSAFLLEWSYSTQLFKLETIQQISKDFEKLLETLTLEPSISFQELATRNELYWNKKLEKWNDTNIAYQIEESLVSLISVSSEKYGQQTAITAAEKKLSYHDLKKQAGKVSKYLVHKGVKTGDVVAIALQPSAELAIAILGIMQAGATFMILDSENPNARNSYILTDAGTKIVLVSQNKNYNSSTGVAEIIMEDILSSKEIEGLSIEFPNITGQNIAYVKYECHPSGNPVAIYIKHLSLINLVSSLQTKPGIKANEKLLSIATQPSEILVLELLVSLSSGAEIVLANLVAVNTAQYISDLILAENIDILSGTSICWKRLLQDKWVGKSGLRIWHFGEILTKELADQLLSSGTNLWNLYGQTETTFVSTIKEILKADEGINLGWPINNTQVFIYDLDGKPAPHGKNGEIVIGGDGLSAYSPSFAENHLLKLLVEEKPNQNLYKTGDLGRFSDNGDLQYLGRLDQQVKLNGIRVEPAEIEMAIAKQNNVKEVIIISKEDKLGDIHLLAYIVLKDTVDDNQVLINHWKQQLILEFPSFMVPESFIIIDHFPRTVNNEIDKFALPKPKVESDEKETVTELQMANELWITAIWNDILGIKEINRTDDFFELGGNSMLAVKMMSEIEKKIGTRLPLAILLKNSSIAKLVKRILAKDEVELWKTIVPFKTTGSKTPLYLIHGAGLNVLLFNSLTKYFDKEQPVYAIQAYGLNGELEIPSTIEEIAKKHIEEIFENDPVGPFAIAGYSLGGYIAYEMAKQLQELGKEVCFLGLIDTYGYNKHRIDSDPFKLLKKFKRQLFKIPYLSKSFINNPKEALGHQVRAFSNKVNILFSPEKVVKQYTATEEEGMVYKTYVHAYESYALKKSDLKINLFSVEKRLYYLDDRKYLGWKDLTSQSLDIYDVPGDHNTFLHAPNDKRFAEILQLSLDKAVK